MAHEFFRLVGSETSAYSATMALLFLVKNPEKLDRLSEELESEFGYPNGSKIPDVEKLKRLPYLNAVINESMRILPVTLGEQLRVGIDQHLFKLLF